jgi:hypothetical protein
MRCLWERWRHDAVFLAQPTPTMLLREDFTIAAVSRSYAESTGRCEEALVGRNVFDMFPENPEQSETGSRAAFADSFERVLRTGRPHRLNALRYDVEDPWRPGRFLRRRWSVVSVPVRAGAASGVLVQVEDVTFLSEGLLSCLRSHRGLLGGTERGSGGHAEADQVDAVLFALANYKDAAAELTQLRTALVSRPAIEQAKGIIMADRKCTAEEAVALLKRLSNDTYVRLADVAAAVVYQRTR